MSAGGVHCKNSPCLPLDPAGALLSPSPLVAPEADSWLCPCACKYTTHYEDVTSITSSLFASLPFFKLCPQKLKTRKTLPACDVL